MPTNVYCNQPSVHASVQNVMHSNPQIRTVPKQSPTNLTLNINIHAPGITPSPQSSPCIILNASPSCRRSRRDKCKKLFVAKCPYRAQLNVYICISQTTTGNYWKLLLYIDYTTQTATDIYETYCVCCQELPSSSRRMHCLNKSKAAWSTYAYILRQ
eukprot:34615_1